jgi:phosphate-induced protein 1
MKTRVLLALALGSCLAAAAGAAVVSRDGSTAMVPTGKGWGEHQAMALPRAVDKAAAAGNGIVYHNGPVMLGTTVIYYIWYGNWSGNAAVPLLQTFAGCIGGSPYYNINTTYYDNLGRHVSNSVVFGGSTTDNYSHGTSLSDAAVQAVVSAAISGGRLPSDVHGVYYVVTSPDVNETSGFCTQYCGWHNHATIGGKDIKYSFVGSPTRCPAACEPMQGNDPNGTVLGDSLVFTVTDNLNGTVTDPDLTGWYDAAGAENSDKCLWTFGATYTTANGSKANVPLCGHDWLLPQNWVNAGGGYCALHYP